MNIENIVVVGANSDIASEFVKRCIENNINIFTISSNTNSNPSLLVRDYLNDKEKIISYLSNISNPTIIFFNGYLKENRPFTYPSHEQIISTFKINLVIPFLLTKHIIKDDNYSKLIYISSMAAVIPRYKNYIYGITKKNLEINIKNLDSKKTLFIRFGQVKTKMSTNHPNAPFTLSASDAAYFIFNNLHKSNIIYHSFGTRVLAILFKILPLKLINYMESKQ